MNGSMTWKTLRNRLVGLIILMSVLLAAVSCGSAKPTHESVVVRDTVIVTKERKLVDTLTLYKDTVIYQDRVKLKIEYIDNFVKVEAACPTDTVRIETIRIHNTITPEKKKWSWEGLLGWTIAILAIIVILREVLRGIVKRLF